jgi:hypothetical protein
MPTHCTATNRDGTPCKAWAVHGSDPPRCSAHGGGSRPVGAPKGNANAQTHGYYTATSAVAAPDVGISGIIADLAAKQAALSSYIDACLASGEADVHAVAHLLALHGQNASRLGRLLRDQRALSGDAADGIAGAIAQALDELSTELEVTL